MKIKLFLKNNQCIIFDTGRYETVEAFAEDLAELKAFGRCPKNMSVIGDFIDFNSFYVKYDDIVSFTDEVLL